MSRRDRLAIAGGVAALAATTLIALTLSWARMAGGWASFGDDLRTYEAAADRLVETGNPYSRELLEGPVANEAVNVPIAYFYPPPLAQAFVLVRGVDHLRLATMWTLAQAAIALVVLPLVWRRAGGQPGVAPMLWLAAFAVGSYPFQFALANGNVSGWLALLVGALLVARTRAKGFVAGAIGLLKTTYVPILLVALLVRRSRVPMLATGLAIVALSIALAPSAWLGWLAVLPNLVRLPPGGAPDSISLASIFRDTSLGGLASAISAIAGLACLIVAAVLARHEGLSRRVVTAAVASSLLLYSTFWDHYLALMVPIAIATWPNVSDRWRPLLVLGAVTHLVGWLGGLGILRAWILLAGFIAIAMASLLGDVPDRDDRAAQGSSSG